MIFAPAVSLFFVLFMLVLPAVTVIANIVGLLVAGHSRWVGSGRWWPVPMNRRWCAGLAFLVLCDIWTVLLVRGSRNLDAEIATEQLNRAARADFVLPRDVQHGEFIFPAGTRIKRYDPFDNGELVRPMKLTGLTEAHFARDVDIAGVSVVSLNFNAGVFATVELAHDQSVRGNECRGGQRAFFLVPHDHKMEHDFKEDAYGPDARFKPSQWIFQRCA
ncbi:hypothetical protein BH11PSE13_BH11PSE13_19500 [soil metagenome]